MKVSGARTAFNMNICKRRSGTGGDHVGLSDQSDQSTFTDFDVGCNLSNVNEYVEHALRLWSKARRTWGSEHLTIHLNLQVPGRIPDGSRTYQALCFAPDQPAVLLTLYEYDHEEMRTKVEQFAMTCARNLTHSLLNFVHHRFILLPCTLKRSKLSEAMRSFNAEVKTQEQKARVFYGGPLKLDQETFDEMVAAVPLVANTSEIPYVLSSLKKGEDMQKCRRLDCLDEDWWGATHQLVGRMLTDSECSFGEHEVRLEALSAALEAARRVSWKKHVMVITNSSTILRCMRQLCQGYDKSRFTCQSREEFSSMSTSALPDDTTVLDIDDAETGFRVYTLGHARAGKQKTGDKPQPIKSSQKRRRGGEDNAEATGSAKRKRSRREEEIPKVDELEDSATASTDVNEFKLFRAVTRSHSFPENMLRSMIKF